MFAEKGRVVSGSQAHIWHMPHPVVNAISKYGHCGLTIPKPLLFIQEGYERVIPSLLPQVRLIVLPPYRYILLVPSRSVWWSGLGQFADLVIIDLVAI